MPRPASAVASDGLPLWDTFEALFFFVAGLSVGIVLGILLPSLWRTLRRRFRRIDKVAPLDDRLLADVLPPLAILRGEAAETGLAEGENDDDTEGDLASDAAQSGFAPHPVPLPRASLAEAFVYARYLMQERKAREAIRVYLDLLKSDRISKGQTGRALFELAQCYVEVGLEARALDTYLELHHRKPNRSQVLLKAVPVCARLRDETRLVSLLSSYVGTRGDCQFAGVAAAGNHNRYRKSRWRRDCS